MVTQKTPSMAGSDSVCPIYFCSLNNGSPTSLSQCHIEWQPLNLEITTVSSHRSKEQDRQNQQFSVRSQCDSDPVWLYRHLQGWLLLPCQSCPRLLPLDTNGPSQKPEHLILPGIAATSTYEMQPRFLLEEKLLPVMQVRMLEVLLHIHILTSPTVASARAALCVWSNKTKQNNNNPNATTGGQISIFQKEHLIQVKWINKSLLYSCE